MANNIHGYGDQPPVNNHSMFGNCVGNTRVQATFLIVGGVMLTLGIVLACFLKGPATSILSQVSVSIAAICLIYGVVGLILNKCQNRNQNQNENAQAQRVGENRTCRSPCKRGNNSGNGEGTTKNGAKEEAAKKRGNKKLTSDVDEK